MTQVIIDNNKKIIRTDDKKFTNLHARIFKFFYYLKQGFVNNFLVEGLSQTTYFT